MIYDFCEIEIHLPHKVNLNFGALDRTGYVYPKGELFKAKGFQELDFFWKATTRFLTIKGSLPFFFQGHNFRCSANDLRTGYDFIGDLIGVNLFRAFVNRFEVGELLCVDYKPKLVFDTHSHIKGMTSKPYDYGKCFEDKVLKVKLYDASKRMNELIPLSVRNKLQSTFGYQPDMNYVRIENHYKKPEIRFKRHLTVAELVSPSFQETAKDDLLDTYESIMKTPALLLSDQISKPSTSDIYLMLLKESELRNGTNLKDDFNRILQSFPDVSLNKEDKKSRRKKFKADSERLTTGQCLYDLSQQLREKMRLT